MPLFNFKCENCGKSFEELVRSGSDKIECPQCKSQEVKKQLPNRICGGGAGSGESHSHGSGCG